MRRRASAGFVAVVLGIGLGMFLGYVIDVSNGPHPWPGWVTGGLFVLFLIWVIALVAIPAYLWETGKESHDRLR